jgi:hypothetical protein
MLIPQHLWVPCFMVAVISAIVLQKAWRARKKREWSHTVGEIRTVAEVGGGGEGENSYACAYVFRVDEAPMGGLFYVSAASRSTDILWSKLIGVSVNVAYDPVDCSENMVDEWDVKGFEVTG